MENDAAGLVGEVIGDYWKQLSETIVFDIPHMIKRIKRF